MNAVEEIKDGYDQETLKEIASHGCQSGVCSQHIYYGDTVKFYEKYEDEIIEYITDAYDTDFLVKLFKDADANLTSYKNSVTWCFIEMIAFEKSESVSISDTMNSLEEYNEDYAMANAY